jgi:hypothetical protein
MPYTVTKKRNTKIGRTFTVKRVSVSDNLASVY